MIDKDNLDGPGTWGGEQDNNGVDAGNSNIFGGDFTVALNDPLDNTKYAGMTPEQAEKAAKADADAAWGKASFLERKAYIEKTSAIASDPLLKGILALSPTLIQVAVGVLSKGITVAQALDKGYLTREMANTIAKETGGNLDVSLNEGSTKILDNVINGTSFPVETPTAQDTNNQQNNSTEPGSYNYDMNDPQMMEDFVNTFLADAWDAYQKKADGITTATDDFKSTTEGLNVSDDAAMGDLNARFTQLYEDMNNRQGDLYNDYTTAQEGNLNQLRDDQTWLYDKWGTNTENYLDDLIAALDANSNDKLPTVKRNVGSQTYEWTPSANRAAANDARNTAFNLFNSSSGLAKDKWAGGSDTAFGLFDRESGVATDTWDKGSDIANNIWTEGNDAANTLFDAHTGNNTSKYGRATDTLRSDITNAMSGDGTIDYLAALKTLVDMENNRSATDKGIASKDYQTNVNAEANEPGLVDYLKAFGSWL